jgi:hypothetical protein
MLCSSCFAAGWYTTAVVSGKSCKPHGVHDAGMLSNIPVYQAHSHMPYRGQARPGVQCSADSQNCTQVCLPNGQFSWPCLPAHSFGCAVAAHMSSPLSPGPLCCCQCVMLPSVEFWRVLSASTDAGDGASRHSSIASLVFPGAQ